jgi:hypothetical protein
MQPKISEECLCFKKISLSLQTLQQHMDRVHSKCPGCRQYFSNDVIEDHVKKCPDASSELQECPDCNEMLTADEVKGLFILSLVHLFFFFYLIGLYI